MKKKIALINQDSGYLMIDLANAFHSAGYQVTLITGRLIQRNNPLIDDIELIKIINYNRKTLYKRLFTWGFGTIQILFFIWFKLRHHTLVLVSNPPFAIFIPLLVKNKFKLLIYDIYPDVLYELNFFSPTSLIVILWQKANNYIFRKAEQIITISDGMRSILEKYAGDKTIDVIPIWTDNNFLGPISKEDNTFIKNNNLFDKFLVIYSGNIGLSHSVEVIPELARTNNNPNIIFIVIGDGEKKHIIEQKINEYKLTNIMLLPYQPASELPNTLSAADIAIVTLGKDASKLSVPSKTYNFMSVGAVLLCISDTTSELAKLVNRYQIGKCFLPQQIEQINDFIDLLYQNKTLLIKYRNKSIEASKDFDVKNIKRFL